MSPVQDSKPNMSTGPINPEHAGGKKVEEQTNIARENPGPIASDSLAAESSAFQSSNKNSTPMDVKGANSTFANTNTSGAEKLSAAEHASDRGPQGVSGTYSKPHGHSHAAGTGLPDEPIGELKNPNHSKAGEAPSYVNTNVGKFGSGGVHGKNLTELGPDEKFFKEEQGAKQEMLDPGRRAADDIQKENARTDTNAATSEGGGDDKNPYSALKVE